MQHRCHRFVTSASYFCTREINTLLFFYIMRKFFQTVACFLAMSAAIPMMAGNEPTDKPGALRGRIVDSDGRVLPGASVFIKNINTGTVSNENGSYTVTNLTPGTYLVRVSYVGYKPVEMKITMNNGRTVEQDFVLQNGILLGEAVVAGTFSEQRRAINTQRNNLGITNVVSADQVGKFPDSNVGDALKRISGINVQYDMGEARFGQVRGTSADMTSVTVNGNRLPSAEGDTRNVQLDLIPADMVRTIEVNKAVTADMDGDAIGGSINLVTKNTPYRQTLGLTVGTGYNWISDKMQFNGGLTWGNRFFNNRLGIMAALSYQNAPVGADNVEFEYIEKDGEIVLDVAEIRQYYVTRERQSYSLAFDFDLNPNHKFYLKGLYNRRNDWENRYRLTYKDISEGEGEMSARIQTKGGSSNNRDARLERQQTMDFTFGGEHLWGRLNSEWSVGFARATEDRPDERYFDLQLKDQTFDFVGVGGRQPYSTTSVSVHEGKWKLKELTNGDQNIAENEWKARLNFTLPLRQGFYANYLKFGGKYTHKTKERETLWFDYTDAYSDVFGKEYTEHYVSQIRDGFMPGHQYAPTDFVSREYLGSIDFDQLQGEQILEESSGNYQATEQVTSAYLRFDQHFGKKVQLTAGLRLEATHLAYEGVNWNIDEDENESLVGTGRKTNSYVNLLPSLLVKWDATDDLKIRTSITKTLSRPKYSSLVPCVNINRAESPVQVTLGNSDLNATTSWNADLNAEYYFKSVGLMSAGVFYKRIKGFVVDQTSRGNYLGYENCRIVQPKNAGDANLLGVELAFQRDFGFIAPALKCLGFYGTYTYTWSNVQNFNFEGRENESGLNLPGSPKHTANASLFFDKAGVNVRLSYNFASAFIDEMGEMASLDRYYDKVSYLDLNASYTWGKKTKFTFYAEANNLLNQPLRYYQGEEARTMQVEYYGVKVNAGFKVKF